MNLCTPSKRTSKFFGIFFSTSLVFSFLSSPSFAIEPSQLKLSIEDANILLDPGSEFVNKKELEGALKDRITTAVVGNNFIDTLQKRTRQYSEFTVKIDISMIKITNLDGRFLVELDFSVSAGSSSEELFRQKRIEHSEISRSDNLVDSVVQYLVAQIENSLVQTHLTGSFFEIVSIDGLEILVNIPYNSDLKLGTRFHIYNESKSDKVVGYGFVSSIQSDSIQGRIILLNESLTLGQVVTFGSQATIVLRPSVSLGFGETELTTICMGNQVIIPIRGSDFSPYFGLVFELNDLSSSSQNSRFPNIVSALTGIHLSIPTYFFSFFTDIDVGLSLPIESDLSRTSYVGQDPFFRFSGGLGIDFGLDSDIIPYIYVGERLLFSSQSVIQPNSSIIIAVGVSFFIE